MIKRLLIDDMFIYSYNDKYALKQAAKYTIMWQARD